MTTIGATLKEARTKKAVSLEEVHAKIKIHPRVLELLEEDKFEKLPSPLFVKSFLRSYAEFLEVDPDELVAAYEKKGHRDPEQVLFIKPPHEREARWQPNRALLALALLGLGGLAVLGAMAFGLRAALSIRQDGRPAPVRKAAKAALAKAAKTEAAPEKDKERAAPKESSGWLRSAEQGNFPNVPRKAPLELQVKALDNVWMRVTCDGKVLFQAILRRGAQESWTAADRIEIWTGNSSNMALTLNRYPLGSPGKGVIKKMVINHDGVKVAS